MSNDRVDGVATKAAMGALLSKLDTNRCYGICGNTSRISKAATVNANVAMGVVSNGATGTACAIIMANSAGKSNTVAVASVLTVGTGILGGSALANICTATTSADNSGTMAVASFVRIGTGVLNGNDVATEWKRFRVGGVVSVFVAMTVLITAMFAISISTTDTDNDLANPKAIHTNSGVALDFGLGNDNVFNTSKALSCSDDRMALAKAARGVNSP